MKCPYCGYEKNKENAKECGSCGKRLDINEEDNKRRSKRKGNDIEINTPQLTEVEKLQRLTTANIREYYKRYCPMPIVHRMNAIETTAWIGFAVLVAIFIAQVCMVGLGNVRWSIVLFDLIVLGCLAERLGNIKTNFSVAAPILIVINSFIVNFIGEPSVLCMIFSVYPIVTSLLLWYATSSVKEAFENKLMREE